MSTLPPLPPQNPYSATGAAAPLPPGSVPNHLAWAIVSTVLGFCLCCVIGAIPGIVAIVKASKVNTLLAQGDMAGAQLASASAKTWCWVTTGLAIFGLLLNIVGYATGGTEQYQQLQQEPRQSQQQWHQHNQ